MTSVRTLTVLFVLVFLCAANGLSADSKVRRPNVILISIDTLRADHLGCYGYDRNTTPNLDRLAKESLLFEQAYSTSPWTLPAHMAMHTGVFPPVEEPYEEGLGMAPGLATLTQLFKKGGYRTAGWTDFPYLSSEYGFNPSWTSYLDKGARKIIPESLAWLQKTPKKKVPFFLFLHLYDPHYPYPVTKQQKRPFYRTPTARGRRMMIAERIVFPSSPVADYVSIEAVTTAYDTEIFLTDEHLGKFFEALKSEGLYDGSLILVLSDHGESLYDHEIRFGHGLFMHDEVIRIPFLLKPPVIAKTKKTKARRIRMPVSMLDVFPTLLDAAGLRVPDHAEGRSLAPLFSGKEIEARPVFARSSNLGGSLMIRFGEWKWLEAPRYSLAAIKAYLVGNLGMLNNPRDFPEYIGLDPTKEAKADFWPGGKICDFIEGNIPQGDQLFRITEDRKETENLAKSQPGAISQAMALGAEVRGQWEDYRQGLKQKKKRKAPKLSKEEKEKLRSLGYLK